MRPNSGWIYCSVRVLCSRKLSVTSRVMGKVQISAWTMRSDAADCPMHVDRNEKNGRCERLHQIHSAVALAIHIAIVRHRDRPIADHFCITPLKSTALVETFRLAKCRVPACD